MTPSIAASLETPVAAHTQQLPRTEAPSRQPATRVPHHTAAVLDEHGAAALSVLVDGALQQGLNCLSLDVGSCVRGTATFLKDRGAVLAQRGVAFRALTNLQPSREESETLDLIRNLSEHNTPARTTLTLAVAYSTKNDLTAAAASVGKSAGEPDPSEFQRHMAARNLPPVDLFLYAGGSARLSGFLLWHAAYAELAFCSRTWAEFAANDLRAVVADYAARNRTFGALKK
jgi:undecaprenyl pyrophosphate synthase